MLGAYSADFLFNVDKRAVSFCEYNFNKLNKDLWYQKVTKDRNFDTKSERLAWLMETAGIDQLSAQDGGEAGGQMSFDELAVITTEFFPAYYGRGFKMSRIKWENFVNGSNGQLDPLTSWAGGVGKYGAYVPQRQVAQLLLNGANVNGYDGVPFWSASHPTHPTISGYGVFANVFTGGASGVYPGACPIDDSVSTETALTNLAKILSYIRTAVLQPNGMGDPRRLVPKFLIHPVRMTPRVNLLLEAAYLPLSANSGGGSADVRNYLSNMARLENIEAPEIGAAISYVVPYGASTGLSSTVTGSDTTWYVGCEEATDTELGSLIMSIRKPFAMNTFSGEGGGEALQAVLSRSADIESHYKGWYGFNYGHPYGIFQVKAS